MLSSGRSWGIPTRLIKASAVNTITIAARAVQSSHGLTAGSVTMPSPGTVSVAPSLLPVIISISPFRVDEDDPGDDRPEHLKSMIFLPHPDTIDRWRAASRGGLTDG